MRISKASLIAILMAIGLSFISLLRSENFDNDFHQYAFIFENFTTSNLFEPGFNFILAISKIIGANISLVLFISALFSLLIKFTFISKLGASSVAIFFLLYASSFFLLHELNQTRLALSIAFIFPALINRSISLHLKIFLSILAFSFHYSIILLLPFIFIKNESKILIAFIIICIIYEFFKITLSTELIYSIPNKLIINTEKIKLYLNEIVNPTTESINFINFGNLITIFSITSIWVLRKFNKDDNYNYLMVMSYMSIISYYFFRENQVLATRISEIYRISLPLIIALSFSKFKKSLTNIISMVFLLSLMLLTNIFMYGPSIKPLKEIISLFGINREI